MTPRRTWGWIFFPVLLAAAGTVPAEEQERASPRYRLIEESREGRLQYRLLLGDRLRPESARRLIVWLHPLGTFPGRLVEEMAAVFVRNGFAAVAPPVREPGTVGRDDLKHLLGAVLPEVGRLHEIDSRRPVLFGFSGGGQAALDLWRTKPSLYGGLVLVAAYPIEQVEGADVVIDPPAGEAAGRVPVLVFVGEEDPVASAWERAEGPWREAGVPLTIRRVPGKGHEWLLGGEERSVLEAWLRQAVAPPQEEPAPAVQP